MPTEGEGNGTDRGHVPVWHRRPRLDGKFFSLIINISLCYLYPLFFRTARCVCVCSDMSSVSSFFDLVSSVQTEDPRVLARLVLMGTVSGTNEMDSSKKDDILGPMTAPT